MRSERSICPLTMLVERSMITMRIERNICPLTMLVERSMRIVCQNAFDEPNDSLDFILQRRGRARLRTLMATQPAWAAKALQGARCLQVDIFDDYHFP